MTTCFLVFFFFEHELWEVFDSYQMDLLHACIYGH